MLYFTGKVAAGTVEVQLIMINGRHVLMTASEQGSIRSSVKKGCLSLKLAEERPLHSFYAVFHFMKKNAGPVQLAEKNISLLFLTGAWCWLAIAYALNEGSPVWQHFLQALGVTAVLLCPLALFYYFRQALRRRYSAVQYRIWWMGCFVGYLPGLALLTTYLWPGSVVPGYLFVVGVSCLLLELLLLAQGYYYNRIRHWSWIRQISLEKAVLLSLVLLSLCLGVMAVSSWGDPEYHDSRRLLLGFVFRPQQLLQHMGLFVAFTGQLLLMYLCGYFYFYINLKWLVPEVLRKKGVVYYMLTALAVVGITYPLIGQFLLLLPINDLLGGVFPDNPFRLESAFAAAAIILLSLPVVLAVQWARQYQQIVALEKEKTQAELDLLRQQLDPHFFFNTLNNLYALSLQQSPQTPDSILQLSELMRYVIYRAKEPLVSVAEEVKYLQDYIDLQQMRLRRKPDIQCHWEAAADTPPVAPLLLIVLVENAFKHGIEPADTPGFLHLRLRSNARHLSFSCENPAGEISGKKAGIGLDNLRRRLSLLYPGRYELKTGKENHIFKAELYLDFT